tara:strand:+ start:116 stop:1924 length:1809 start_codon:yes stop_codon:yes gene_type:complete
METKTEPSVHWINKKEAFIPPNLTSNMIMGIEEPDLLKKLITARKWGGKGGYFLLRDVKKENLSECKKKAISILEKEIKASNYDNILDKNIALGETIIQGGKIYIRDTKGLLINKTNKLVKLPCKNSKKEIIGYGLISIEDYEIVHKYPFHIAKGRRGEPKVMVGNLNISLSRLLLGDSETHKIKYINDDRLDCRRENLLLLTLSQLTQSKTKTKGVFSSDYKGVTKDTVEGVTSYRATISFNGKYLSLGTYETEIEAAKTYDISAYKYYGENCGNNDLLTEGEVEEILNDRGETLNDEVLDEETLKGEINTRNLPKYISITANGNYYYQFTIDGVKYYKMIGEDLDEAVEELNQKMEQVKKENESMKNKTVTRNSEGQPIIFLYKNKEIIREVIVSEETWLDLNNYSWHLNDSGYASSRMEKGNVLMHVYIYKKYISSKLKKTVDHINNLTLDNRLENLREASMSLQNHNRPKTETSIIKDVKGVTLNGNRFIVNPYGDRYSFTFLEDAARKFNELATEKFGDDVRLNPDMGEGKTKVIDLYKDEDITVEFIQNIKHVELFKLIVKKKGWGGKNGEIYQSYVKASTLEEYKKIAIDLLEFE